MDAGRPRASRGVGKRGDRSYAARSLSSSVQLTINTNLTLEYPLWCAKIRSAARYVPEVLVKCRLADDPPAVVFFPRNTRRGEPFSAKTTRAVSRTRGPTAANDRGLPPDDGRTGAGVRLAQRARHREARDVAQMAPHGVSDVLALEVAPARPATLPKNIRELVRQTARENPTWGEQRIADELSLRLGIKVSARTVGKYLRLDRPPRHSRRSVPGESCI